MTVPTEQIEPAPAAAEPPRRSGTAEASEGGASMLAELNRRQKIAVAVIDVLVLCELTLAMYVAHSEKHFTIVFAGVFLGALVPTLFLARRVIGRLGDRQA